MNFQNICALNVTQHVMGFINNVHLSAYILFLYSHCYDGRWSLGVGMGLFLLAITISSLLVISVCQQNAYIWLGIVMVSIIFLTTFTCTTQVPILWAQETDSRTNSISESDPSRNLPPYWIRVADLPPSYSVATSHRIINIRTDNVEPPPYSHVILQPPNVAYSNPAFNYNETDAPSLQQVTVQGAEGDKRCTGQTFLCDRCHHVTQPVPQSKTENLVTSSKTNDAQDLNKSAENSSTSSRNIEEALPPDRASNVETITVTEENPQLKADK